VSLFLATCFAIANDSKAPESWLEWAGWVKLVCGLRAHRRWNYTLDKQPVRFVRWYIRSIGAPFTETVANLGRSAWAWAMRREPPWIIEARQAAEKAAGEFEQPGSSPRTPYTPRTPRTPYTPRAPSVSMSSASVHSLSTYKRAVMAAGLLGVYVTWAIFAWFIFTCACLRCAAGGCMRAWRAIPRSRMRAHLLLSFRMQMGCSFTSCWATMRSSPSRAAGASATASTPRPSGRHARNPGFDGAAQRACVLLLTCAPFATTLAPPQDILIEALKGALILAILERLYITRNSSWLEVRRRTSRCRLLMPHASLLLTLFRRRQEHIDYYSLQALLYKHAGLSVFQQTRLFFSHTKRQQK
jgi:hypothetical protein